MRRTKAKQQTMADIIHELEQKLIVSAQDAENMHADFDNIQLSIFRDTKNNTTCTPTGRRYSDIVKEFAVTLNYYSPKAYDYVRSILPLPHPSLIRKWSSLLKCEPDFIKESFESIGNDAKSCHEKRDCCLIIDAMSTRKQIFWDASQGKYVGFVNYGETPPENPDTPASEAVVFLLVGARSHWKCPIGYFLANKMSAKMQANLVKVALKMNSKNANCQVFSNDSTTIIPFFHSRKHKAPLNEPISADDSQQESDNSQQEESMLEENFLCTQLNTPTTSEFLSNILFYISGFVVSKLVKKISCSSCKNCLLSQFNPATPDHEYCSVKFSEVASASAFTLFINNGGLRIPSESVYLVVEYAEKEFKACVCKDGNQITREGKLKEKLVMNVYRHFIMDSRNKIFQDHEQGLNENLFDDHKSTLIKLITERYITLRLFTYGKRYN